jgi:molybdopterin-guanine dinucleotide biosynthesis protein B
MNLDKCFGIAGWKNSGKTSLVAALVTNISARGFKVSTIKHAHHAFDLDTPNTDSYKHREAGANEVVLVSANRWAIQHELRGADEPDFETMLQKISPCDLVLVEGYKQENIAKLEIIGPESERELLWQKDKNIMAIACDTKVENCPLPSFHRNAIDDIADFILKTCEIEQ